MMGQLDSPSEKGIIPRLCEKIFDGICESPSYIEFTMKVSYVEIYQEQLRDLLNPNSGPLKLREGGQGIWIENVMELYVNSLESLLEIMADGHANRATSSTHMNQDSSRSHSVFIAHVGQRDLNSGSTKTSKLFLVDLAGSEKIEKTGRY
jgi:kinesin family protein 5